MSKRSWDSLQRTRVWAASPWRRAFNDEIAFPSGVFGPLDMEPLRRADSSLRREDIFSLKLTGERAEGWADFCMLLGIKEIEGRFLFEWPLPSGHGSETEIRRRQATKPDGLPHGHENYRGVSLAV